jgi:hypothetical protein
MNIEFEDRMTELNDEYAVIKIDGRPVVWVFRTVSGRTYINGLNITATEITDRL